MIELIMTICAVAEPTTCRDERILLAADTTPWQCTMNAPPYLAQWGVEHPKWFVQRWQCRYQKKEKDI